MTVNIGYCLGHLCEFVLFVYFASISFYPRKNYVRSGLISLVGYIVLYGIGLLSSPVFSIVSFFIVNTILLIYCYKVRLSNAVFFSLILDTMSCIGEYGALYAMGGRYNVMSANLILTTSQMTSLLIISKIIYLIGILFFKYFSPKRENIYNDDTPLALTVIPILTIICISTFMPSEITTFLFLLLCVAFMVINFITFYINTGLNNKNNELKILQEEYNKNKAELAEYHLLSEKYENTKIMRHDFHKQLDVLKGLITADNIQAKEYMQQIQFSQRELDYTSYTDNKILNILLAQKVKDCHNRGIEIHIHSKAPTLSFISEIDTVAIFSNMIDNAIEAAEQAQMKEIYVDLYTVNKSYSAVKIENYVDEGPIILDGLLRTQKENINIHGMGIKSINTALKKYNSELTWSYDKEKKFFRAIALIHIPNKDSV